MAGFVSEPSVVPGPNADTPLVAVVRIDTRERVSVVLDVADSARSWSVEFPAAQGPRELPVLGMRANSLHRIRARIPGAGGIAAAESPWMEYRTPRLPRDPLSFPGIDIVTAEVERMEPGYTLLSVRRAPNGRSSLYTPEQQRFGRQWGAIVVLDAAGKVVWYHTGRTRFAGVTRLRNGNLLVHRADSTMTELDMLGNVRGQWYPAKQSARALQMFGGNRGADAIPIEGLEALHHEPFEMPDGHLLAFGAHSRRISDYYTSETDPRAPRREQLVVGDRVVEFDRNGRIVWQWDTFDHLDPFRIGYELTASYWQTRGFPGALDWTHGNGVSYSAGRDLVLASFRHQDASIAIERSSGRIRWILGEPSDWGALADKVLKPVGDLRWPYHSHNPRFTAQGTVIMFDNGTWGARPFSRPADPGEHFSRTVEFEIDERAMTVRQVWTSAERRDADSCSAIAMGDAWRLPRTNNILEISAICARSLPGMTWNDNDLARPFPLDFAAAPSRVREYTRAQPPEIVFEARFSDPNGLLRWDVYGGERIETLYPESWARVREQ